MGRTAVLWFKYSRREREAETNCPIAGCSQYHCLDAEAMLLRTLTVPRNPGWPALFDFAVPCRRLKLAVLFQFVLFCLPGTNPSSRFAA